MKTMKIKITEIYKKLKKLLNSYKTKFSINKSKYCKYCFVGFCLVILFILLINIRVINKSKDFILNMNNLPQVDAIIIPGALVRNDGRLSDILKDRLNRGIELYNAGKSQKILVTGDHGRTNYNEVQAMKNYLLEHNIPEQNIFMDHAGFDTYDSLYRARDVFQVKSAIFVSQNFHINRGVYIGKTLGLEIYGYQTKLYYPWYYKVRMRDWLSRVKAFLNSEIFKSKPKYLGDPIPISGDGRVTQD